MFEMIRLRFPSHGALDVVVNLGIVLISSIGSLGGRGRGGPAAPEFGGSQMCLSMCVTWFTRHALRSQDMVLDHDTGFVMTRHVL